MGNPTGRPSKRSPEVIERIISGLSAGTPLTVICRAEDMPDPANVWRWAQEDKELSQAIAHARTLGFDRIAEEALEIIDGQPEVTTSESGGSRRDGAYVAWQKLRFEGRLKLLAKWDPKRYGERIAQELSGPDGQPIKTMTGTLDPETESAVRDYAKAMLEKVKYKAGSE